VLAVAGLSAGQGKGLALLSAVMQRFWCAFWF